MPFPQGDLDLRSVAKSVIDQPAHGNDGNDPDPSGGTSCREPGTESLKELL